jgi:hypothetical protein
MDFNSGSCSCKIFFKTDNLIIKGNINESVKDFSIMYYACSPVDRRTSLSGSGLPYANSDMAFGNTPNKGIIQLGQENAFTIKMTMPGSFYEHLGTVLIPPTVYIKYNNGVSDINVDIPVAYPVPYRLLTYPSEFTNPRTGADFYYNQLPVRSQEQIFRDSEYPSTNVMADNFWGLKPPQ